MFNAFEELFSPGRKHTQDEQKRLALTREDVGDGAGSAPDASAEDGPPAS
ncbi:DUF6191 domain-containing protein [Streptomyces pseudogriseolus]